jgi:UDP-glucose 4-epimerase
MSDSILVTGGAGLLGSHVARCLIESGNHVVVLDDLSGGSRDNVHRDAEFIEGNILDEHLVDSVFAKRKVRDVYHLAAYAAEGLSHFIKRFNYRNNLIGSVNLINSCINHGVECLVFTSSIAVYGANGLPMTEELRPQPIDPYGIAKLAVEQELNSSHDMFGLKYVIFRPHNIYGEGQNIGDPYRNVIGIFMNQIMQNKPLTVFGNGTQTRAFTYVRDIAPVIARAHGNRTAYGHIFNIGADKSHDLNSLAEAVGRAMGTKAETVYLPARKEIHHAYPAHQKVRKFFDCPPETPLEEGLGRMAAWAAEVGPRQRSPISNIEVEKGLPPSWRNSVRQ